MTFRSAVKSFGILIATAWLCVGCFDGGESAVDEQKDPHFLEGKRRANSMDYSGAVNSFEKALEANPRSASAHFELGLLYYQRISDYVSSIYHFERFLRLKPNAEHADNVRQFITVCKQEISKTVSLGPTSPQVQRDLERLTVENAQLRHRIEALQTQLASRPVLVTNDVTNPAEAAQPLAPSGNGAATKVAAAAPAIKQQAVSQPAPDKPAPKPVAPAAAKRSHVVKPGDTLSSIARRYGVKLGAITSANPGLDSRKLRTGQIVVIPDAAP